MTIQAFLLGAIVPIFLGASFHLWRGGATWRLGLYILLAEVGFWVGHLVGTQREWNFLKVGSLQMGAGVIGGIFLMAVGYWLSSKREAPVSPRPKKSTGGSARR